MRIETGIDDNDYNYQVWFGINGHFFHLEEIQKDDFNSDRECFQCAKNLKNDLEEQLNSFYHQDFLNVK